MTETDQLIQDVEQSRTALIAAVSSLTEAQGAFKPAEGHWSVAEVLEHLYLAELSGIARYGRRSTPIRLPA